MENMSKSTYIEEQDNYYQSYKIRALNIVEEIDQI